ncbi:4-hydroxy-tetrahydrodipicolinate synthase [Sphingomonas immobilis]|uniref:4-hydroxy-tetrahydrodipicolinate synthase n=1 Tax=Sphingomonas immobilis TaxID=3063997 RepID=A0ABT9A5W1_9SPHN|nr:4-hydroxy-tetrahydrodipicolinate synthase [Sphingomonas sp. CA1-15]MDO7844371.1 4-hydroxy-tetrahydrodipicolinate synthase [Sphingomonas sp. CA1-15]
MFTGSIPALVTPFTADGSFAEKPFRDFVEWQIAEGSSALVPCGTTGESATMDFAEHFEVVRICVDQARGRVPVIAGAGSNDTRIAIKNAQAAKQAGADCALMVPPYYNRPSQEGIFQHFAAVAEACDLPVMLYNVPGRTVTDILPDTMGRLVKAYPQIFVAVKDATGSLTRVSQQRAACGPDWCQLSGNDETAIAFTATGGVGCVSVTANVAPRLCAEFQAALAEGNYAKALTYQDTLFALHTAMFADASPGPAKYAVSKVIPGFPTALRLPMTPANEAARAAVDAAMAAAGI